MTEWISVKDRLPEKNGIYFVCYEETELSKRCIGYEWFSEGKWIVSPYGMDAKIIYWMLLPEPPED